MTLTPEQKTSVSEWVAAGDNLYAIQKKLIDQFKVSMTYMDVRFLVDDLDLQLKDPAPKVDTSDVSKGAPAKEGADKAGSAEGALEDEMAAPSTGVSISVDKVSLNPNAMASGTMRFPDGVTGRWIVDHQGRPGIVEVSKPGYRPSAADSQAFMQELSAALQRI
jgi:hypothetical protein